MMFRPLIFSAIVLACSGAGTGASLANDEPVDEAGRVAILNAIRELLDSLRDDDGQGALDVASDALRDRFERPEAFLASVRLAHRPIYKPIAVDFLRLTYTGSRPVQEVLVVDEAGEPHLVRFSMIESEWDGSWQIDGWAIVTMDEANDAPEQAAFDPWPVLTGLKLAAANA